MRGDEWLGTLPLHVQLYNAFGFPSPSFAHIAPIAKMEGNAKRKLSKRKDPEANVAYYFAEGLSDTGNSRVPAEYCRLGL